MDQFHKKLHVFVYQSMQRQAAVRLPCTLGFHVCTLIHSHASQAMSSLGILHWKISLLWKILGYFIFGHIIGKKRVKSKGSSVREKFSPVIVLKVYLDFLRLLFNSPLFSTLSRVIIYLCFSLCLSTHTQTYLFLDTIYYVRYWATFVFLPSIFV